MVTLELSVQHTVIKIPAIDSTGEVGKVSQGAFQTCLCAPLCSASNDYDWSLSRGRQLWVWLTEVFHPMWLRRNTELWNHTHSCGASWFGQVSNAGLSPATWVWENRMSMYVLCFLSMSTSVLWCFVLFCRLGCELRVWLLQILCSVWIWGHPELWHHSHSSRAPWSGQVPPTGLYIYEQLSSDVQTYIGVHWYESSWYCHCFPIVFTHITI